MTVHLYEGHVLIVLATARLSQGHSGWDNHGQDREAWNIHYAVVLTPLLLWGCTPQRTAAIGTLLDPASELAAEQHGPPAAGPIRPGPVAGLGSCGSRSS
jgi:hypothetical protein